MVVSSANLAPTLAPTLPSTHPSPIPRPTLSEVVKGMEVVKAIEAVGGRARSKSPHAPAVTRQRRTRPSGPWAGFSGPWGRRLWHWLSGTHFPTHSRTHPPTPEHIRQPERRHLEEGRRGRLRRDRALRPELPRQGLNKGASATHAACVGRKPARRGFHKRSS